VTVIATQAEAVAAILFAMRLTKAPAPPCIFDPVQAFKLHLQGLPDAAIATRLGATRQCVCEIVRKERARLGLPARGRGRQEKPAG
jgi:hypothetical protein